LKGITRTRFSVYPPCTLRFGSGAPKCAEHRPPTVPDAHEPGRIMLVRDAHALTS